ncbi:MAG: SIMPL domain-containing protein [bacterium]
MDTKLFTKNELMFPAIILSIGFVMSASVVSDTFYKIRGLDNVISVTGSTKTRVTSDSVKWSSSISRTVTESNMKNGYSELSVDLSIMKKFFASKGIKDSEITISPVFTNEVYKYNSNGNTGPREFTLMQNITINSIDIPKITEMAKNTQDIIDKGVFFSNQSPEYYYSKLSDLRVNLLGDAIKDAKARAEILAGSGGRSVGAMKSAASGVVQVLAPNSIEVSDYGQYDTSSIDKDIMVTARASFIVQ